MSTLEFIMMIGIIILSTYITLKLIADIKQFLSRWTIINSDVYDILLIDSRHNKELTEEVTKLNTELELERR